MDCCLVSRVEYRWRRGSSVGVKENIGKGTIELVLMSMLLEEDMYGYQLVQSIKWCIEYKYRCDVYIFIQAGGGRIYY